LPGIYARFPNFVWAIFGRPAEKALREQAGPERKLCPPFVNNEERRRKTAVFSISDFFSSIRKRRSQYGNPFLIGQAKRLLEIRWKSASKKTYAGS
jgi:hypothetical protein